MDDRPYWKTALFILLVAVAAVALSAWWALQTGPGGDPAPGAPVIVLPEQIADFDPDRIFCAESPETGVCRCITAAGERPEIPEEQCRRLARAAATRR